MHTDVEPTPRLGGPTPVRIGTPERGVSLPRTIREPDTPFLEVLRSRRSSLGGDVCAEDLSSLLWHATVLRERRMDGRFGIPWESRPAPSAGGLHAIRIVVLPLDNAFAPGEYLPDIHALAPISAAALDVNRASVAQLLGCSTGTTLQLACDENLIRACYDNAWSLMWREAGALVATLGLVATSLGLTSVILGRTGGDVLSAANVDPRLVGVGAVHVGASVPA